MACINHQGGTRSWSLDHEACQLHERALAHQMQLRANHCPGLDNVFTDYLSRNQLDPTVWSLLPSACLFQMWGRPQIVLFASLRNRQLQLWFSHHPCLSGSRCGCLSTPGGRVVGIRLPSDQLDHEDVAGSEEQGGGGCVLVVPFWSRKLWFPLLL